MMKRMNRNGVGPIVAGLVFAPKANQASPATNFAAMLLFFGAAVVLAVIAHFF